MLRAVSETTRSKVRLDKWLWAARFYKTRSQSAAGIKAGRVEVDGGRARPSHQVGVGARVDVRKGPYLFSLEVRGLAERRGSAEIARALYAETEESVRRREETHARLVAERADVPRGWGGRGRPTKKQRRALMAFQSRMFAPEDLDDDLDDETDEEEEP
jgi:ribosome-associated heat shock protein Hsp15